MSIENDIVAALAEGKDIRVTFTKADGTVRVLNGTWNEDVADYETGEEKQENLAFDLIKIYDISISEWRSFKPSRVISWEII